MEIEERDVYFLCLSFDQYVEEPLEARSSRSGYRDLSSRCQLAL